MNLFIVILKSRIGFFSVQIEFTVMWFVLIVVEFDISLLLLETVRYYIKMNVNAKQ